MSMVANMLLKKRFGIPRLGPQVEDDDRSESGPFEGLPQGEQSIGAMVERMELFAADDAGRSAVGSQLFDKGGHESSRVLCDDIPGDPMVPGAVDLSGMVNAPRFGYRNALCREGLAVVDEHLLKCGRPGLMRSDVQQ